MIEDDFYSTIKLTSGEEIFAKVAVSDEDNRMMLILDHPVTIESVERNGNVVGYKLESWLKTTTEDMFLLNMRHVMTMTESTDIEIISLYQNFVRQFNKIKKARQPKIDRKMGYISTVGDAKDLLEKIFKKS
jgi:hypothetical protein